MTPDQIGPFLRRVAVTDPRILPTDEEEAFAATALWAVALIDVDYGFALNAVAQHYGKSPFLVKPSDVVERWRAQARDKAERHIDPLPAADPDDPVAYAAELRASRQAAAAGTGPQQSARAALGPGRYEIAANSYQEDDLSAMRMEGDLKRMWSGSGERGKAEMARCKALVLAHEDLAARLAQPPINIRPDAWTGFIPMEQGGNGLNRSPVRRALAEILAEAERRAA